MKQINTMEITEDLLSCLKRFGYQNCSNETQTEGFIASLLSVNDYLIDKLTEVTLDDVEEIKKISLMQIEMKSIRNYLNELNENLRVCHIRCE